MKPGNLERLRKALSSGKLTSDQLWWWFTDRITLDTFATSQGHFLSPLGLPSTNSVTSLLSGPSPNFTPCLLSGIPFLVKENFCVKASVPTTCASKALHNYYPPYNASVVQALLDAGGACLGKTNMDEFAMGSGSVENSLKGPVVNPWSSKEPHIAGGSSGGSAAAVAAGLAPFALASDTGGSVRNPAALCGVVGLKPTYGLASRRGLIPLANTLDCPSIVAARVKDVVDVLCVWMVPGNAARRGDATLAAIKPANVAKRRPKIGIPREYHAPGMTTEITEVWDEVAGWLADELGVDVLSVSLPHTPIATAVYSVLCAVDVASNMSRYDGLRFGLRADPSTGEGGRADTSDELVAASRELGFGDEVRSRILAGNFFLLRGQKHRHFDAARQAWRLVKRDYDEVFTQVDFLLTPVSLHAAPCVDTYRRLDSRSRIAREDPCTIGANLAGLPAVALPIRLTSPKSMVPGARLPLGLQLIGPPWSEGHLLHLAGWIEERADFPVLVDVCALLGVD